MTSTSSGIFSSPLSSPEPDPLSDLNGTDSNGSEIRLAADAIKSIPLPSQSADNIEGGGGGGGASGSNPPKEPTEETSDSDSDSEPTGSDSDAAFFSRYRYYRRAEREAEPEDASSTELLSDSDEAETDRATTMQKRLERQELLKEFDHTVNVDSDTEDALSSDFFSDEALETEEAAKLKKEREREELLKEKDEAWTEKDVDSMMHDLKEDGMFKFLNEYVVKRRIPVRKLLLAFPVLLSRKQLEKSEKALLPVLKAAMIRVLRNRTKIPRYNTTDDAVRLIKDSARIIVLTGAGISVSCGIPDFRSRDGLYATLQNSGVYSLDDPQQMFDIEYFKENPNVFYSFAHQIYPSNFEPSPCHRFIKKLERYGKLLRNYTQNIDTLESMAGIRNVLQCHGSFATASCIHCHVKVPGSEIKDDIMAQRVPFCKVCNQPKAQTEKPKKPKKKRKKKRTDGWESDVDEDMIPSYPPGIMKPDITFFGEKLTDDFDKYLMEDLKKADLLLIIGTSLKVAPVSEILTYIPHRIPQIVINKTPIKHINPDIMLLGDADYIIKELSSLLRFSTGECNLPGRAAAYHRYCIRQQIASVVHQVSSHIWLFPGASRDKYIDKLEAEWRKKESRLLREALSRSNDSIGFKTVFARVRLMRADQEPAAKRRKES